MRDSRNVLHARLATARTKQKHNCGGINERVRANYRGVGNPQNRREPPGRYHAEKAHDQPVGKPSEKIRELRLFFGRTMNLYPTDDPARTVGGFVPFARTARAALERVAIPTSGDSKAAGSAGRRQPDSR